MDHTNEDTLKLLQDIKDMLAGIALILLGGFVMAFGSVLLFLGIILSVTGLGVVFQGYRAHKVIENHESAESSEQ